MRPLSIEETGIVIIVMIVATLVAGLVWYYAVIIKQHKRGEND